MFNKAFTSHRLELLIRALLRDNINFVPSSAYEVAGNTWNEEMVIDSINYAVKEYCTHTSSTYTEVTATLSSGSAPNSFTLPFDSIQPVRVFSLTNGNLHKTTKMMEALKNPFWEVQTGPAAKYWYVVDGRTVGIIPNLVADDPLTIGYIQNPWPVSSTESFSAGDYAHLNVGQWYEIFSVGDTDFTTMGAPNNNVGTQFKLVTQEVSPPTNDGQLIEIIDPRIIPMHQEYLKYAAAYYLLNMAGDHQSIALADKFLTTFTEFIEGNSPISMGLALPRPENVLPKERYPHRVQRAMNS